MNLKTCLCIPILCTSTLFSQTVNLDPTIQRFIGGVSDLDRSKYFTLHSSNSTDADLVQFYNDYDVIRSRGFWGPFSYANQQTGVIGQYPGDIQGAGGVRPVNNKYIATEHPKNVIRYNLDTNAAADWVVEYYKDYSGNNPIPEFYEVMNEPFVHAGDAEFSAQQPDAQLMRVRMAEWFGAIGEKVDQTPELANLKIIGFADAWPQYEHITSGNMFGIWHARQKMFMDVAGANVDAFSTHLYDGVNVNQDGGERSGSNAMAILDMVEAYSHIKWGLVKPHVISEYGGIASGYPAGWNDIEAAQSVMSQNKMIFDLMDREDRVEMTIPFVTDKSNWHLTAANNYEPYGAVLLRPGNTGSGQAPDGTWVYTPKVTFYEIWKGVKGKRIAVSSDHADIQTQAFVDGNKLFVALNNLDDVTHNVSLNFASTIPGLQNVRIKALKIYANSPHSLTDTTQTTAPSSITLIADETVMLEYTYQNNITFGNAIRSQSYYADKYLQDISANVTQSYLINGVTTGTSGYAKLKMSLGRTHAKSKAPTLTVNGTAVSIPSNWRGYDQTARGSVFFGTIEIPVPIGLIQANNTINITFPDSGGAVSSLILEVAKHDTPIVSQAPFGGTAHAIPGTIEAEDFDIGGEDVAYNDTASGNSGASTYRAGENVDIEATTDTGGGVNVGWIAGGEWLEYTVDAAEGSYDIELRVASGGSTVGDVQVSLGGTDLGTFAVENTGGWQTWTTLTLSNVAVTGGSDQVLRLTAVGGNFNLNWIKFNSLAPETIGCELLPTSIVSTETITVDVPYSVNQARDVVVEFWDSGWLDQDTVTVGPGTGVASVTLTPMGGAPAAGSGYLFKTSLREVGAGWQNPIDSCNSVFTVLAPPETIGCEMLPTSIVSAASFSVDVPYSVNESRDIVVEFWDSGWLHQDRVTVTAGSGVATLTLVPAGGAPPAGTGYLFKTSLREVGAGWQNPIDSCNSAVEVLAPVFYTATGDIGSTALTGSTSEAGGIYTLQASGADIWGTADEFQFASQVAPGSVSTIIARVDSLTNTNTWSKAGVMFRADNTAGAQHAMVVVRPDKQVVMQVRTAASGSTVIIGPWLAGGTVDIKWVRLIRNGDVYTGAYSADGTTWTTLTSSTIAMGSDPLVGLAVTSHDAAALATAEFSNVSIRAGGTYDFGTASSPTQAGYTQITNATTSGSARWASASGLNATDRTSVTDNIQRDVNYGSQANTFRVDLSDGVYEVTLTIGDTYAHDDIAVKAEGVIAASNIDRSANQWSDVTFTTTVSDGTLDLEFSDGGGTDVNWVINGAIVTPH
ncbi:MAG: carbohydrate-binding protein [Verrucomicrobiota bacterium]